MNQHRLLLHTAQKLAHRFAIISVLSCLVIYPACPQIRVHRFSNISVEQGLSHFRAYDILQDRTGYLWVATMDGLDRYDGYDFTVFRHDDRDSGSIADNVITSLCEDKRGNLWVGTKNGVLHRFLTSTQTFERHSVEIPTRHGVVGSSIRSIYEDAFGFLWIGTESAGLCRISVSSKDDSLHGAEKLNYVDYSHNPLDSGSLASNSISSVLMDNEGVLWVCTDGGLDALVPGAKQFRHYRHVARDPNTISNNVVVSVCEDKSGVLWIGTGGGGLDAFDKLRAHITHYKSSLGDSTTLSQDFVTSICEEDSPYLWVGTQVGLNRLDRTTGRFTRFMHDPSDPTSLIDDYVVKVSQDMSGNIWIVTDRGLSKMIKRTNEFLHYRHEPDRFAQQSVTAVLEDSKDYLWIGTENGVKRFDRKHNKMIHYKPGHSRGNLLGEYVQAIIEDPDGNIWIGTLGGGLNKHNPDGSFEHFTWPAMKGSDYVMSLCEDGNGRLWVGTMGDGLLRFDVTEKKFDRYMYDPDVPRSLSNNIVPAILVDKSNTLWVGTEGGGLNKLELEKSQDPSREFTHFRHDVSRAQSISNDRVYALCEDRNGRLWVATGDGLDLYDRGQQTFEHILSNGHSFTGQILGIVEDGRGNLWLSTMQNGLYKLDPETKRLEKYDADDGLQSNRFYYATARSKTGEILLGGENGFNVFHPDSIKKNTNCPNVVLTEFRIFDKPTRFANSTPHGMNVELDYQQNYFSFEFAALDHTMPWKNEYMYTLEGFDKDWIYSGRRRMAAYTNIDPGKYIFRAKGSNNDHLWSEEGLAISVTIKSPYWATWWFRGLLSIMAVCIVAAIYRYRVTKLLEIERMRLRIARDLHDDIGSSLGSIALTSDVLQSSTDLSAAKKKQLAGISGAARKTAETLRDIVWVLSPTCDTTGSLVLKLKDEASLMLQGIEHSFEFVEMQKEVVLDMDLRHNIILIYKEALHNIIKHSKATAVAMRVEVSRNEFKLRIRDNGIGFDPSAKRKGNGLENMKWRGEKFGYLEIGSAAQEGTEILLVAKIP